MARSGQPSSSWMPFHVSGSLGQRSTPSSKPSPSLSSSSSRDFFFVSSLTAGGVVPSSSARSTAFQRAMPRLS
ncbi:MAG: hypothetical protein U1F43_38440 [Myxococcota bacterium]